MTTKIIRILILFIALACIGCVQKPDRFEEVKRMIYGNGYKYWVFNVDYDNIAPYRYYLIKLSQTDTIGVKYDYHAWNNILALDKYDDLPYGFSLINDSTICTYDGIRKILYLTPDTLITFNENRADLDTLIAPPFYLLSRLYQEKVKVPLMRQGDIIPDTAVRGVVRLRESLFSPEYYESKTGKKYLLMTIRHRN